MVQAVNTHLKLPFPQNPLNVVSFPSLTDLSPVYGHISVGFSPQEGLRSCTSAWLILTVLLERSRELGLKPLKQLGSLTVTTCPARPLLWLGHGVLQQQCRAQP